MFQFLYVLTSPAQIYDFKEKSWSQDQNLEIKNKKFGEQQVLFNLFTFSVQQSELLCNFCFKKKYSHRVNIESYIKD